jgi:hypothetical protein
VASPGAFLEGLRAGFWLCFAALCLGMFFHSYASPPHQSQVSAGFPTSYRTKKNYQLLFSNIFELNKKPLLATLLSLVFLRKLKLLGKKKSVDSSSSSIEEKGEQKIESEGSETTSI